MDSGGIIMDGPPSDVRRNARVQDLYFGAGAAAHAGGRAKIALQD
jgi:hypothetical protein